VPGVLGHCWRLEARIALPRQNLDEPQVFDRHELRGRDKQSRLLVEGRWIYRLVGLTYMVFTVEKPRSGQAVGARPCGGEAGRTGEATDLRIPRGGVETRSSPLPGDEGGRRVQDAASLRLHKYTVALLEKGGAGASSWKA